MKSKAFRLRAVILAIILLVGALGVGFLLVDKANCVAQPGYVYVPTGASYQTLLDSLGNDGKYLRSMSKFRTTAKLLGLDQGVRPGRYRIPERMSYTQVVRMFQRGLQTPMRVTFNNIRTLPQLAGRIARQLEPDSLAMLTALTADTTAARYGFTPQTFLSMFIPNTYEFYWNTTPAGFIARMQKEYDKFWNEERTQQLAALGLTRAEAVTLASIVYEEAKMSDEMPVVAGVYLNRLRLGMPLQADPTVKFALGDFSLKRILHRHLEIDSPYNTYRNPGLPPGPICMPSIRAVDAVLHPMKHNYLYFCAKPDFSGYHNFAATLAAHNRNAQAYAAALNKRGIR